MSEVKSFRLMTPEEIANFRIVPSNAKIFKTYEEFNAEGEKVSRTGKVWQSFCDRGNGIYWIKV